MTLFIKKIIGYFVIFFVSLYGFEISYANVESDYSYKASFLENATGNIENLILGSSHTYYGINPQNFQQSTFNLAHVNQSLDLDVYLLEKYLKKYKFKNVIIPISYFSFNASLRESTESWRITNYYYYYDYENVKTEEKFFFNTHRKNFFSILLRATLTSESSRRYVDINGFVSAKHNSTNISIANAEKAIARHTMPMRTMQKDYLMNKQLICLQDCIYRYPELNFILVSLPVHRFYSERQNIEQLFYVEKCINHISTSFDHVEYLDYRDMLLPDSCFKDTDHLSSHGAKIISEAINEAICRFP